MRRGGALRRDENGQLMMLAGIVLTISFILTALTLAQVTALERQAAAEGPDAIVGEWRFLHERLGSNLRTGVGPETTILAFTTTVHPTIAATFRALAAEKGYDLVVRLAGGPEYLYTGNEETTLLSGANYAGDPKATTYDGAVTFTHVAPAPTNDGIIWQDPCPDPAGPVGGCIAGVYVYLRLSDGTTSLEESVLFATNQV